MQHDTRKPMTPEEFDAACRALIRRVPDLSCTSGARSKQRNDALGASPMSKHLIDMARDYAGSELALKAALAQSRILGLWGLIHGEGANEHLHVQGLPPGDVPFWWADKYGQQE